jgi:hypothetical protein
MISSVCCDPAMMIGELGFILILRVVKKVLPEMIVSMDSK